jgi:molybdenum cofactor cytidylyltransferase
MNTKNTAAVILAAGESKRMNTAKALLQFNKDITFIEKIVNTYSQWGCKEIVVVTSLSLSGKLKIMIELLPLVRIVVNGHPEFERFYSVKLGLGAIHSSSYCFIQNVDNPFIDTQILDLIYEQRSNEKYISPVYKNKGGHPVLLNLNNISRICNWSVDSANFKNVLSTMESLNVEMPDGRVLININSPEEYQSFFKN